LVALEWPRAALLIEGIGRFEFELCEDEPRIWQILRAYLLGEAQITRDSFATRLDVISRPALGVIDGSTWAAPGVQFNVPNALIAKVREVVHGYAGARMFVIPAAKRIVVYDSLARRLSLDFVAPFLIQWSIDPVSSPAMEMGLGGGTAELEDVLDAFCAGRWVIKDFRRPSGHHRLVLELRASGLRDVCVENDFAKICGASINTFFPWLEPDK